ncbi:fluoride efflux transporter FluC [Microbacterium aquimaris]|uniref:Fluoride-specific ion channel FluC n=1 Tax=Microbacterium aquimaris TaxID=459816 RepID=A0ABU5N363_9MICO|nr:CrcB family protein [Microbacterium aquimaris]MDZ8160532.1 CrcB family protein [Microbacterium aquimaris]
MSVFQLVVVAVAGGVGAGLRYSADVLITGGARERFPRGIFLVNAAGSFALGVVTGLSAHILSADAVAVLGTGLLGGFTTFSTVSVDTALMFRDGQARRAVSNLVGTVVVCVAAASAGIALAALV